MKVTIKRETRTSGPAVNSRDGFSGRPVILLVDDNSAMVQIARHFLEQSGYNVLAAQGGFEAELIFTEFHETIDLLLTDLDLGDCSGVDLAKSLRRARPALKVLVISGRPDVSEVIALRSADFPSLAKPFTREQLVQKVSALCRRPDLGTAPGLNKLIL